METSEGLIRPVREGRRASVGGSRRDGLREMGTCPFGVVQLLVMARGERFWRGGGGK